MRWGLRRTLRLSIVGFPLLVLLYFLITKSEKSSDVSLLEIIPTFEPFIRSRFLSDWFWKPHVTRGRGQSEVKPKFVYFVNPPSWFRDPRDHFKDCEVSDCVITLDARQEEAADAVMFWGADGLPRSPPQKAGNIWILLNQESPIHSSTLNGKWSGVFNWTMSYKADSDVFNPYGFLVHRPANLSRDYLAIAAGKSKTVAWFVSNCFTPSRREDYVKELRRYMQVDVYGSCGDLHCPRANSDECLSMLNSTYRFYLSFENSLCEDYVTEKFFHRFWPDTQVVPVVRGGTDYKKYFPEGTFINTADFPTPRHLAEHLTRLADDPVSYAQMLQRKDRYVLDDDKTKFFPRCELCRMLHQGVGVKYYSNISSWVGKCWDPQDLNFPTDAPDVIRNVQP